MTTVEFYTQGSRICGFECRGHTGFAEEGADILCSAVTSAVRLVECAVNEVMGIGAPVRVNGKDASILLRIPDGLNSEAETLCQTVLSALMTYLAELHVEHPNNIEVIDTDAEEQE